MSRVNEINTLYERINKAMRSFHNTIGKLDIEKGPEQLEDSKKAYREQGSSIPGKFFREFEKLKNQMAIGEIEFTDVGKSTYIRWGSDTCNGSTSIQIFSGYVATSSEMGVGGGTGFLCLPKDAKLGETLPAVPRSGSFISGVTYGIIDLGIFEGKDIYGGGVICSVCHVSNRSSVITQVASSGCPDGWIMEYEGFMATSKDSGHRSSYVCLDKHPSSYVTTEARNTDQNLHLVGKTDGDSSNIIILPCVVCSK